MKNHLFLIIILVVFLGACAPYQGRPQYQRVVGQFGDAAIDSESYRSVGLLEAVLSIPQKVLFGERQVYTEAAIAVPGGAVAVQSSSSGYYQNCMTVPGSGGYCLPIYNNGFNRGYNAYAGNRGWGVQSRW